MRSAGADRALARSTLASTTLLAVLLGAFWLHALLVPFWQDDLQLLLVAREAREAGEGWLSAFWPTAKSIFWRPLSEGIYWRLVEGPLEAQPVAAHALNLISLIAACLAVAWLVADYARLVEPAVSWRKAFLLAGSLYGVHAAHFVPAVWATAVHTSMVVLFSALALRYWVAALRDRPTGLTGGLVAIPLFLLLALFSKENGIMTLPLGALMTALTWQRARPTRAAWAIAALSVLLAGIWVLVRREMVVPPMGSYKMDLGTNSLRNLVSMALFFLSVPREALRFVLEQHSAIAALWALACAGLQAAAVWLVVVAARPRLGLGGGMAALAFFLIAAAPHLLFSWNSYAYYITQGLMIWPFLAAIATLSPRRTRLVLALALLSSGLSVAGNYLLDYPALLARAEWAQQQRTAIRAQFPAVADQARSAGIDLVIKGQHRYLAIGVAGLALDLDLPREVLYISEPDAPPNPAKARLVFPDTGNPYFE